MNLFCEKLTTTTVPLRSISGIHPNLSAILKMWDIELPRYKESSHTLIALSVSYSPVCCEYNGTLHIIAGWPLVNSLIDKQPDNLKINVRIWTGRNCWRYRDVLMTDIFTTYIEQKRCGIRKTCINASHADVMRAHLRSNKSIWADLLNGNDELSFS